MERGLIGRPVAPLEVIVITLPLVRLLDVTDRGVRYVTPREHLGTPILDASPANVASLALAYLDLMLKEAAKLSNPPSVV
jgi:hypothetical protein